MYTFVRKHRIFISCFSIIFVGSVVFYYYLDVVSIVVARMCVHFIVDVQFTCSNGFIYWLFWFLRVIYKLADAIDSGFNDEWCVAFERWCPIKYLRVFIFWISNANRVTNFVTMMTKKKEKKYIFFIYNEHNMKRNFITNLNIRLLYSNIVQFYSYIRVQHKKINSLSSHF